MKRTRHLGLDVYSAAMALAVESSTVIGMRMLKGMRGGQDWPAEVHLMVEEKTRAAADVHALIVSSVFTGAATSAPARAIALYRRRVRANRRRLSAAS